MKRFKNEKGIALAMVLVLSFISLAIVATLIYLVTQGTRFSGFFKRYETAREASYGGSEVTRALIMKAGDLSGLKNLPGNPLSLQSMSTLTADTFVQCDCGDTTNPDAVIPTPDSCLCRKLCSPTLKTNGTDNWPTACDKAMDPTSGSYDLKFKLAGFGTNYDVFGKIVDTSVGNTDFSGLNLGGTAVVASTGTISAPPAPYLYTIEITGQDENYGTRTRERGRLSVLYAR